MRIFCRIIAVLAVLSHPAVPQPVRECTAYAASRGRQYNIILISINNIGAEHMSLYGYGRKTTPCIDRWAANALVFEDVFTPASWTLPAITSVFTSCFPYTHGVLDRLRNNVLDPRIKTLAEILRSNGYEAAAFTGGTDVSKDFGHMRGFSMPADNPPFTGFDATITQSKEWLAANSKKKFFLFIQGYDAHPPFLPPPECAGVFSSREGRRITIDTSLVLRGYKKSEDQYIADYKYLPSDSSSPRARNSGEAANARIGTSVVLTRDDIDYLRDLYDEEILSVDRQIGRFLDSLNKHVRRNTIIVIFSEHGEMFAKHGRFGRAGAIRGTLYDDVVHVPLIVSVPGRRGRRIAGLTGLTDIMPTLLELVDVSAPEPFQGRSLMPLIDGNVSVNDHVYAGARYNLSHRDASVIKYKPESICESIRSREWKLIREIIFPGPGARGQGEEEIFELYDLRNDPDELHDCIALRPVQAMELKERLRAWSRGCSAASRGTAGTRAIPDKLLEDVRRHGYW